MSESIISDDTFENPPPQPVRRRHRAARVLAWFLGCVVGCLAVLYLVLLISPIRLPFSGETARNIAASMLPPHMQVEMGDLALALEGGVWPVARFSPVIVTDRSLGARIAIDAVEVGFSPLMALIGQPGATVTIVGPHLQMTQDLNGPRMASMELQEGAAGSPAELRLVEGETEFPSIAISSDGVEIGDAGVALKSDNDWLVQNLQSTEASLAEFVLQSGLGRFSRLSVRDGTIEMSDSVFGLYRRFDGVSLDLQARGAQHLTTGRFGARIAGREVAGTLERMVGDDGSVRLRADMLNVDFAAIFPFLDDPAAMAAVRGAGALSLDVSFDRPAGAVIDGQFRVDLTGLDLRLEDDYFPVASSILVVNWNPAEAAFEIEDGALQVGQSSARVGGRLALGLDDKYGPVIGISLTMHDLVLQPPDMAAPAEPFEQVEFSGWSAPLYGALGIDRIVARKGDTVVEAAGRVDALKVGTGLSLDIVGQNVSADDAKRLWPSVAGKEGRDWFVANVSAGHVVEGRMAFNFPPGSMEKGDDERPMPPGAIRIDLVGEGVEVRPSVSMDPIPIAGFTHLQVEDTKITVSGEGGALETAAGPVTVRNPALVFDTAAPGPFQLQLSGALTAEVAALVDLIGSQAPDALALSALPVDLEALSGAVDMGVVATVIPGEATAGVPVAIDYVVNGTVADFASSVPIAERSVSAGQLAFSASQDFYELSGTADVDGMQAEFSVQGTPNTEPVVRLASTVEAEDLAEMGFDVSPYLSGRVRFVAQPLADEALQVSVDLTEAGVNLRDIGLSKAAGTPGSLEAVVRMDGEATHVDDIALQFGETNLAGQLEFHATQGLLSARFDRFALSAGDEAQVIVAPIDGGYAVSIQGEQLDLKPMLDRFFGLGEGSGGVQSSQFEQTLLLDVNLDRAIGYYATTAFNLDLNLTLSGRDMRNATLSAQFSEGNAISITTNPAPNGRTLSVAFNDAGTLLRFVGIYSQLAGGTGSLVLTTDRDADAEGGQLLLRNFAIVDEANVREVLGNHSDSRDAIAANNRLDFTAAQVDFIRRSDRVEVMNAVLTGDTVGGTLRGFIYSDSRLYDLTGTYVPLFGLNNAFQQIPLLGPLLGGRDGEGLLGVTFAVKGPLSDPQFLINPLSVLAPGALRELFEFRARELPPADAQ